MLVLITNSAAAGRDVSASAAERLWREQQQQAEAGPDQVCNTDRLTVRCDKHEEQGCVCICALQRHAHALQGCGRCSAFTSSCVAMPAAAGCMQPHGCVPGASSQRRPLWGCPSIRPPAVKLLSPHLVLPSSCPARSRLHNDNEITSVPASVADDMCRRL